MILDDFQRVWRKVEFGGLKVCLTTKSNFEWWCYYVLLSVSRDCRQKGGWLLSLVLVCRFHTRLDGRASASMEISRPFHQRCPHA
jgi:hypothetical protein